MLELFEWDARNSRERVMIIFRTCSCGHPPPNERERANAISVINRIIDICQTRSGAKNHKEAKYKHQLLVVIGQ